MCSTRTRCNYNMSILDKLWIVLGRISAIKLETMQCESLALLPGDLQLNRMFSLGSKDITLCITLGWLICVERRVSVIGELSVHHLFSWEFWWIRREKDRGAYLEFHRVVYVGSAGQNILFERALAPAWCQGEGAICGVAVSALSLDMSVSKK